ncbi:MAG TPA: MFS transporter [Tepidisphaeraceae bacterium]|nr:MFS transporter [Tepidisphaeraceae bacterium]
MTGADLLEYAPLKTRTSFYYGWIIVAVAALAMVATLPGRTFGLGLITEPLLRDLNITHVSYGGMNLVATLIGSAFCLGCGSLIDRLGSRVMLTATFALLGGTVLAMSRVRGATGLLATLILTRGFGQSMLSVVSLTLVGKWFSRRLSMAMGVYSLAMGIGFMAAIIGLGQAVGASDWRHVWRWMGWALLVGLAPLAWLTVRRSPESIGLAVDGSDADAHAPIDEAEIETGLTLAEALRSPAFWAYALAASTYGLIASGLMLFNQSVLHEHGFDGKIVNWVLAISTLTGLIANLVGGWMAQKWSIGRLLAGAMLLLAVALFALPLAHSKAMVYLYAVTIGLAGGIITVGFFVCWGKVFGRLHLGAIQGAAQGLTVLASAAGPWLLAESVSIKHSSTPLLFALAPVVSLLGIFCALAPLPVAAPQEVKYPAEP